MNGWCRELSYPTSSIMGTLGPLLFSFVSSVVCRADSPIHVYKALHATTRALPPKSNYVAP